MTADDVRARFEAVAWRVSIAGEYKFFLLEEDAARERQEYEDDVGADWLEHEAPEPLYLRAAHADLSGEVRELVEDAGRAIAAWDSTTLPRVNDGMLQERMESLRAALAKFTQEKP